MFLDKKYIALLSNYLDRFKQVRDNLSTFRCPLCGDSQSNKNKTRGYIYFKKDHFSFKCHNCGANMSFPFFLKIISPSLYQEYRYEKISDHVQVRGKKVPAKPLTMATPTFNHPENWTKHSFLHTRAADVPHIKKYLEGRKLTGERCKNLFYVEDIGEVYKALPRYKDRETKEKQEAILVPYIADNKLCYVQARFLSGKMRYQTLQVDETTKKIWGLDLVDWCRTVYVLEGAFDAMLVDNGVSVNGASLQSEKEFFDEHCKAGYVFIYDNDWRSNTDIKKQKEKTIESGISVVIFDNDFPHKDINDAIIAGTPDIMKIIKERTFSGARAKLEMKK